MSATSPGRTWGPPLLALAGIAVGPLLLAGTGWDGVAKAWALLLVLAGWTLAVASLVGLLAGARHPPVFLLERGLRVWVARFSPDPGRLWLAWARGASDPDTGLWRLGRAVATGSREALFQEGIVYLEGGLGPGGQIAARERFARAAEGGHAEATFRLAEMLRTGAGGPQDLAAAEGAYQAAARAGFGPAAAWLAHAYAQGDGVSAHPDQSRRWAEVAARLAPHPPLARSVLRHDAAPPEVLQRAGAAVSGFFDAGGRRLVASQAGRWVLAVALVVALGTGLLVVGTLFWAGASQLHFMPLAFLLPPLFMAAWIGRGLRQDRPRSGRDRMREAAEGGDPDACHRMGLLFRQGDPQHPRDDLSAVLWFRRAAEAGHVGAMRALADAYLAGHGVPRDAREAARWAEAAGRQSTS